MLDRVDRVYLYRVAIPAWVTPILESYRAKVLYDFDDALWAADGLAGLQRLRQRVWERTIERAIRCCSTIVTSNESNAAAVRALGGPAVIIPTCVDTRRYGFRSRSEPRMPLRLGWIGTPSTAPYLAEIEEPLARLCTLRPVEIYLVGAGRSPFTKLSVTLRPWSLDTEIDEITNFDIGIMPMPDTPWTRGKAALKALQYGASGAPTVASWTATNEQILAPAGGTLFCGNADEWFQALLKLVDESHTRKVMGTNARGYIEDHYSVEAMAPKLLRILRGEMVSAHTI